MKLLQSPLCELTIAKKESSVEPGDGVKYSGLSSGSDGRLKNDDAYFVTLVKQEAFNNKHVALQETQDHDPTNANEGMHNGHNLSDSESNLYRKVKQEALTKPEDDLHGRLVAKGPTASDEPIFLCCS